MKKIENDIQFYNALCEVMYYAGTQRKLIARRGCGQVSFWHDAACDLAALEERLRLILETSTP